MPRRSREELLQRTPAKAVSISSSLTSPPPHAPRPPPRSPSPLPMAPFASVVVRHVPPPSTTTTSSEPEHHPSPPNNNNLFVGTHRHAPAHYGDPPRHIVTHFVQASFVQSDPLPPQLGRNATATFQLLGESGDSTPPAGLLSLSPQGSDPSVSSSLSSAVPEVVFPMWHASRGSNSSFLEGQAASTTTTVVVTSPRDAGTEDEEDMGALESFTALLLCDSVGVRGDGPPPPRRFSKKNPPYHFSRNQQSLRDGGMCPFRQETDVSMSALELQTTQKLSLEAPLPSLQARPDFLTTVKQASPTEDPSESFTERNEAPRKELGMERAVEVVSEDVPAAPCLVPVGQFGSDISTADEEEGNVQLSLVLLMVDSSTGNPRPRPMTHHRAIQEECDPHQDRRPSTTNTAVDSNPQRLSSRVTGEREGGHESDHELKDAVVRGKEKPAALPSMLQPPAIRTVAAAPPHSTPPAPPPPPPPSREPQLPVPGDNERHDDRKKDQDATSPSPLRPAVRQPAPPAFASTSTSWNRSLHRSMGLMGSASSVPRGSAVVPVSPSLKPRPPVTAAVAPAGEEATCPLQYHNDNDDTPPIDFALTGLRTVDSFASSFSSSPRRRPMFYARGLDDDLPSMPPAREQDAFSGDSPATHVSSPSSASRERAVTVGGISFMMKSISSLREDVVLSATLASRQAASSFAHGGSTSSSFLPPLNALSSAGALVPFATIPLDSDPLALTGSLVSSSQAPPRGEKGPTAATHTIAGSTVTQLEREGLTASSSSVATATQPNKSASAFLGMKEGETGTTAPSSIHSEAHYEEMVRMLRSMCGGDADATHAQ